MPPCPRIEPSLSPIASVPISQADKSLPSVNLELQSCLEVAPLMYPRRNAPLPTEVFQAPIMIPSPATWISSQDLTIDSNSTCPIRKCRPSTRLRDFLVNSIESALQEPTSFNATYDDPA